MAYRAEQIRYSAACSLGVEPKPRLSHFHEVSELFFGNPGAPELFRQRNGSNDRLLPVINEKHQRNRPPLAVLMQAPDKFVGGLVCGTHRLLAIQVPVLQQIEGIHLQKFQPRPSGGKLGKKRAQLVEALRKVVLAIVPEDSEDRFVRSDLPEGCGR